MAKDMTRYIERELNGGKPAPLYFNIVKNFKYFSEPIGTSFVDKD